MLARHQTPHSLFSTLALVLYFALSAPSQGQSIEGFQLPSKNIACMVFDKVLRCDVNNNLAKLPPRPKSCDLDWGYAFAIGQNSKPQLLCAGDTTMDSQLPVLAYGKTWKRQGFTCTSSKQGLRCQNMRHQGWFLNRLQQKFF